MKCIPSLITGAAALILAGCSTATNRTPAPAPDPKVNYQQAIEADAVESAIVMKTLNDLDSGEAAKARRVAMMPVFVNLDSFRYYATQRLANPTSEQMKEWAELAKATLGYMIKHRDEWDAKRVDVQEGLRGMGFLLREPEEIQQLNALSNYLAQAQLKTLQVQK
jgi:hypothetical protein